MVVTVLGVLLTPTGVRAVGMSSAEGISGTVTEEGGGALSEICVGVHYLEIDENGEPVLVFAGFVETTVSGQYTVLVPPRDDYLVRFSDECDNNPHHIEEWYNNQPTWDTANLVPVISGSITPNIDAALALGGAISGTVTAEESAEPLEGICVFLNDATSVLRSASTDSSGHYIFRSVPSGSYKIRFGCDGDTPRAPEWFDDEPTAATADPVPVVAGVTATAIDAALTVATHTLSVTATGPGSGSVTSSPSGIDCGTDCSEAYTHGTEVNLTATPAAGSRFGGWGGHCSGVGPCTVTMNGARSVQAVFDFVPAGMSIADAAVVEGDSGTATAVFVLTQMANTAGSSSVYFATFDGTAQSTAASPHDLAPLDYQAASGTVSFGPFETTKTLEVTVYGDTVAEGNQYFTVKLTDPVGGTITSGEAIGTIIEDDPFCPGFETFPGRQIVGTRGPDHLTGTGMGEVICGLGGHDTIRGHGGDDVLLGGGGRDELAGQGGDDRLVGQAGDDRLSGGRGRDRCRGGPGDDVRIECEKRGPAI